jgi:endonuclease YncB( thermonuclease family)
MKPTPNITIPAKVVRVIDGDTVDVSVSTTIRVRLEDCWCPERHEPSGLAATTAARAMMPEGSNCLVMISLEGVDEIKDVFTFGRVVGRVFTQEHGDISECLIESGHATRLKDD